MTEKARVTQVLSRLIEVPSENEWVEFKEAKKQFSFDDLGKYFSALSNEANLSAKPGAWLIFGVANKRPRKIVGTSYRDSIPERESLKEEVSRQMTSGITFVAIHELILPEGRVLLFEIPPAPKGTPIAWKGHYYGRNGESLCALSIEELERIRRQYAIDDWTAETCLEADMKYLSSDALAFARKQYIEKNPRLASIMTSWDDVTFLNKARLSKAGKLTNTALLLLGNPEAVAFFTPVIPRMTWILKDKDGIELDYAHFEPPFVLSVEELFGKIRNLTYRYLPDATLFPVEVSQYDPWVIRETLFNAIAHQDYKRGGRITLVETPDSLLVSNDGEFLPGTIENVVLGDAPPDSYRNPWLAQAMVNLNMIDTIGSGIKRILQKQKERFFPLPDYDLSEKGMVRVRIFGRVVDENYTKLLIARPDLSLVDVMALDKIQKKVDVSIEAYKRLKTLALVEGRKSNCFISAPIAAAIGDRAAYIKNKAFDDGYYKDMVLAYLSRYGEAKRLDLDKLLIGKVSDALEPSQKKKKVSNLLQEMAREDETISAEGTTKAAIWKLTKKGEGLAKRS